MARRAASDDSLKENNSRVQGEAMSGVANGPVKREKRRVVPQAEDGHLAGPTALNGFNGVHDDGEDSNGEVDQEDEDEGGTPKGRKRVRVNTNGDGVPADFDEENEGDEDVKVRVKTRTFERDQDGYVPGSIVRVQLKNFVTYDWVQFRPGPFLNMVLGPNGTGKSSIACALCIGLNFPLAMGTETGHIEIELKSKPGRQNLIIRRNLSASSKANSFMINGQKATGKEVDLRMAELNVGVTNLCSFLPQDKVAEFARMSPQELLRETQRAAGDANLTSWHETLIGAGKELAQVTEMLTSDRDSLKTMEERNANLEREVERFKERQKLQHRLELLSLILPFMEYVEAKELYTATKEVQRKCHEKVRRLKERNKPAHALLAELAKQHTDYGRKRDKAKDASKAKFQEMKRKWAENERLEEEMTSLVDALDDLKKKEKRRISEIARLENENKMLQAKIDNPPETENMDMLTDLLVPKVNEKNAELQYRQKLHIEESSKWKSQVDSGLKGLRDLDDVSARKLQHLAGIDRDCADTIRWLRENRHRFKLEIIEPAIISLTIPDKSFMNAVEACFNFHQLKTFVAQCPEDYKTLNNLIVDTTEALGRKGRINTWFRPNSEHTLVGPPLSPEEMRQLNFDGYAIDYVQCPDGLLWYLKKELNMHRTAIALNGDRVNVGHAMGAVSRIGPNGEGGGANFIAGRTIHSVTRSRYGRRLPQNSTRDLKNARNLVAQAIDPQVKQKLERQVAEARRKLKDLEGEESKIAKEEQDIGAEGRAIATRQEEIKVRKKRVSDTLKSIESWRLKIAGNQQKLANHRAVNSAEEERADLKKRLLDCGKRRAKLARTYINLVRGAINDQTEATRVGLDYLQIGANKTALQNMVNEHDEAYQKAEAEYEKANRAFQVAKADSKEKLEISKVKLASCSDEVKEQFKEMEEGGTARDKTADEVQAEMETVEAQLAMNLVTNAGVIEQYERRKIEIGNLSQTIEQREKKLEKIERSIKSARDNWEPALERLVASIGEKFSAAFDHSICRWDAHSHRFSGVSCAGEVRITRHDDFEKWAIDILVKFRDSEKLQLLTGQRQSGGERALTTILYLMSLTEEARAPFALVDEINQVSITIVFSVSRWFNRRFRVWIPNTNGRFTTNSST
ncbi:hypothetical protein JAAARDRAFT_116577 [Jaapia argillacea MUCL 33604]|uniref:Structural maintenance of chromosomes protein 5 n=1 Tax=Jaapia argillacea MUCL 33604 TaxID=933084 RepID=A0A067QKM4_9AGAM|nr:hypothetical protein JAAARDRAFT_116577 [Jaapia argillacea MUCL 33604]